MESQYESVTSVLITDPSLLDLDNAIPQVPITMFLKLSEVNPDFPKHL